MSVMNKEHKKLISIVIPAYNERDNVSELAQRLQGVFAGNPKYDFEVVIVENGSHDDTFEKLLEVNKNDSRFKIIQLARNFRMDGGLTAGLQYVKGDAAVIMTADLQDPPELITLFLEKWEEGYENVYGIVTKREGTSWLRRLNSQLFYYVANHWIEIGQQNVEYHLVGLNYEDFPKIPRLIRSTLSPSTVLHLRR